MVYIEKLFDTTKQPMESRTNIIEKKNLTGSSTNALMSFVGGSDGRGFGGGRCRGNDGGGGGNDCGSSGGGGGGEMGFSSRSGNNTLLVFVVVAVIISSSAIVCWCVSMRGQKNETVKLFGI